MNKGLIITILLISLSLFISGCISTGRIIEDNQEGQIVTELNLEIGEPAKTSSIMVNVLDVEKADYHVYYSDISEQNVVEKAAPGKIFVFVEAEIKNIGSDKEFVGGKFFSLKDSGDFRYEPEIFYEEDSELPFFKETYPGERVKGTLLFEIPESSTGLEVLHDFTGFFDPVQLASWKVPKISIEKLSSKRSADIEINSVDYDWNYYISGSITGIDYTIDNNGEVPIRPSFDVLITHNDKEIYNEKDEPSLIFKNVESGDTISKSLPLFISGLPSGSYNIVISLRDGDDKTILDTDTKTVVM